jgi:predicted metal-dependent enzyme (double-stranded beta helix superfamily)
LSIIKVSLGHEEPHVPRAGTGECVCGCADIHTVNNRFNETAISIHIYARDLEKCLIFEPISDGKGQFVAREKSLSYSSEASS